MPLMHWDDVREVCGRSRDPICYVMLGFDPPCTFPLCVETGHLQGRTNEGEMPQRVSMGLTSWTEVVRGVWLRVSSMKVGRTSMSPLRLMMTR